MTGYWKRPNLMRGTGGGHLLLGPLQFNWGNGRGDMPKGLRIHLTWPGQTRSAYLFGGERG